jgi:hypothetical protein
MTLFFGPWRGQLVDANVVNVNYSRLSPLVHPGVDEASRIMFSKRLRVPKDYDLRSGTVHTFFRDFPEAYDYCFRFPHMIERGSALKIRVRVRDGSVWASTK